MRCRLRLGPLLTLLRLLHRAVPNIRRTLALEKIPKLKIPCMRRVRCRIYFCPLGATAPDSLRNDIMQCVCTYAVCMYLNMRLSTCQYLYLSIHPSIYLPGECSPVVKAMDYVRSGCGRHIAETDADLVPIHQRPGRLRTPCTQKKALS